MEGGSELEPVYDPLIQEPRDPRENSQPLSLAFTMAPWLLLEVRFILKCTVKKSGKKCQRKGRATSLKKTRTYFYEIHIFLAILAAWGRPWDAAGRKGTEKQPQGETS